MEKMDGFNYDSFRKDFSEFRDGMMNKKPSLREIQIATGISASTLSRMLNGSKDMSLNTIVSLCQWSGLNISDYVPMPESNDKRLEFKAMVEPDRFHHYLEFYLGMDEVEETFRNLWTLYLFVNNQNMHYQKHNPEGRSWRSRPNLLRRYEQSLENCVDFVRFRIFDNDKNWKPQDLDEMNPDLIY